MSNKQGIIFDDGVLYRHGENGSSEWLEDGDEKKDGRYIGEIDNGEPNGQGSITYSDGGMYVGEWENGRMGSITVMEHSLILIEQGINGNTYICMNKIKRSPFFVY